MKQVYWHIVYTVVILGAGGYLGYAYGRLVQIKAQAVASLAAQVKKVL